MPFPLSARPDNSTQCHSFAHWFHDYGIFWSGTPAELASQLAIAEFPSDSDRLSWSSDELLSFLEMNSEMLRELGVEVSVLKIAGRPRTLTLRSDESKPLKPQVVPARCPAVTRDSFDRSSIGQHSADWFEIGYEGDLLSANRSDSAAVVADQELESQDAKYFASPRNVEQPVSPSPRNEYETAAREDDVDIRFQTLDSSQSRKSSLLPLAFALLLGLIVVGLVAVFSGQSNGSITTLLTGSETSSTAAPITPSADTADTTAETPPSSPASEGESFKGSTNSTDHNPAESQPRTAPLATAMPTAQPDGEDEIPLLISEAADKRVPASQYELGMRYAHGRGVKQDVVAAYSWLVLALSNGDQRAEKTLRELSFRLSPLQLQTVRLWLGDSYSRGRGVPADYVAAHSWYSLAEVAGSAEGTIRKKQLETKMTPEQIERAATRTTAWLSRH